MVNQRHLAPPKAGLPLKTAGTQTIRARDTVTSTITGTQTIVVS